MKITTLLAAAIFALTATVAQADDRDAADTPSAGAMAVDLLVVRPLGLVATVFGVGLFIVQLPFALTIGDASEPAKKLVAEPAAFTFTRPLGKMD